MTVGIACTPKGPEAGGEKSEQVGPVTTFRKQACTPALGWYSIFTLLPPCPTDCWHGSPQGPYFLQCLVPHHVLHGED